VENKIDLTETKNHQDVLPEVPHAAVSALTGEGMDSLKSTWERILEKTLPSPTSAPLVVNARHSERLCVAKDALHNAIRLLNEDKAVDLALSEIRLAIDAVGEITGGVDNEDMLDQLFQSFCIGK
jgi:tRNA modification GTPase